LIDFAGTPEVGSRLYVSFLCDTLTYDPSTSLPGLTHGCPVQFSGQGAWR
jgi:hypothetical protein